MAKKEYNNVAEGIKRIKKLRDELTNSKTKRIFDKTTVNIKQTFDKLYYYAFYDYRFKTCNYNKLLEDIKMESEMQKPKFSLLFIKVSDMIKNYYTNNEKKKEILFLIEALKSQISNQSDKIHYKNIYSIDNFLIIAMKKDCADEIYKDFKKVKNNYNLNINVCYVKYIHNSAKINKNIETCMKEVSKIIKEKRNERAYENGWQ